MAGVTTGNRALKGRASRKLPSIELPRSQDHSINRAFENIAEYLRTYEGDGTAPKERFVTMRELEESGLVTLGTKNGYSFISQVLKKDVAQTAGSTANPTLKGTIKKDTALGLRTPGGGGGGASNPLEQGKRGITQKLSDIGNVVVPSPAQTDFLYYDGGKWKNYSLFKRENKWLKKQNFEAGITIAGVDVDGSVAAHTHVIADITDFTDNSTNWDTAYGWGDHAGLYLQLSGGTMTGGIASTHAGTKSSPVLSTNQGASTTVKSGNYAAWGHSYSEQGSWMGSNVYQDLADTANQYRYLNSHSTYGHSIYLQHSGSHFWYGDTASVTADAVVTRQLLAYLYESSNVATLELGIASTTVGGSLQLHGTTASRTSELQCTNGNLHIDSYDGSQVYLNYYSNTGGVYIGAAGGFKSVITGQYGSVQTQGSTGGYGGVNLDGYFALMNSGSAHMGLYNDINNEWMVLCYPNSYVRLYHNGTATLQTTSYGARHASLGGYYHNGSSSYQSCKVTYSTSAASGGTTGDMWLQYT